MASGRRLASMAVIAAVVLPGVLCTGTAVLGMAFDGSVSAEVTREVEAPPAAVFSLLDNAAGIQEWWSLALATQQDPSTEQDAMKVVPREGPVEGVGTAVDFVAGRFTAETWVIRDVDPGRRVTYLVDFKLVEVQRTIELTPLPDGGTRVRWAEHGTITNPWMRVVSGVFGGDGIENNFVTAIDVLDRAAAARAEARLGQAEDAARALGKRMKARVLEALEAGGPAGAVEACADEAQAITALAASESGAQVGRASLRLRNPANAGPDWVQAWLRAQTDLAADSEPMREVIDGQVRVILPIPVEAPCTLCHGQPDALGPGVVEKLAQRYPDDQATGYAPGQLRGALWAQIPWTGAR